MFIHTDTHTHINVSVCICVYVYTLIHTNCSRSWHFLPWWSNGCHRGCVAVGVKSGNLSEQPASPEKLSAQSHCFLPLLYLLAFVYRVISFSVSHSSRCSLQTSDLRVDPVEHRTLRYPQLPLGHTHTRRGMAPQRQQAGIGAPPPPLSQSTELETEREPHIVSAALFTSCQKGMFPNHTEENRGEMDEGWGGALHLKLSIHLFKFPPGNLRYRAPPTSTQLRWRLQSASGEGR